MIDLGFLVVLAAGTRIYVRGIQVLSGDGPTVERRWLQSLATWIVFVLMAATFSVVVVAVAETTAAFADSLNSLARSRDTASPTRTTGRLLLGLIILLIWTALTEAFAMLGKTNPGRKLARWFRRATPRAKPLPP